VQTDLFKAQPAASAPAQPVAPAPKPAIAPISAVKSETITQKPLEKPAFVMRSDADPARIYQPSRQVNIDIMPEEDPEPPKPAAVSQPKPVEAPVTKSEPESVQQVLPTFETAPFRVVGELFSTYILVQQDELLLIIDKHAAHERILYEKLHSQAQSQAQMLLQPLSVTPGREEYAVLIDNLQLLEQAGFELEDFGSGSLLVRGVPMTLAQESVAALLQEIAGRFLEGKHDVTTEKLDWIYHSVACRAAVKAGDRSHITELSALAQQVLNDPQLRYCPHGRPVCVQITRRELEKMFGRIV
jgi:DNA mismatch repair protein MutL